MKGLDLYLSLGPALWSSSGCQVLRKRYWELGLSEVCILQALSCLSDEVSVKNSLLVEVQVHLLMGDW